MGCESLLRQECSHKFSKHCLHLFKSDRSRFVCPKLFTALRQHAKCHLTGICTLLTVFLNQVLTDAFLGNKTVSKCVSHSRTERNSKEEGEE